MNFAQPHWLIVGLVVSLGLAFIFRLLQNRRKAALEKFAAHQLLGNLTRNISSNRRRYKNILLLLAVFMCFVALARPQYGHKWVDVKRKGIDLLFALDTSKSMLAEDIKPYRLKRAHLAILDFVRQLEGDRVGLMPFAGSAYLMCPLTLDYDAFAQSLAAITTDIIPKGGTNISTVIKEAIETLNNAANHKILIILTDGENLQGDALQAADEAAEAGLTIYTVGVGTSQGELIPVSGKNGKGFIKDKQGNFVTSKLDESTLTTISEKSGGLYVPLGSAGEGLETIYQQKLALIPKEELAERRHKVPLDRFEWPLGGALLLLLMELMIGERKKPRSRSFLKNIGSKVKSSMKKVRKGGKKSTAITALVLLLGLAASPNGYCSEGEEAYARGDYLQASEFYSQKLEKSPDDPQLNYNYGTSSFKNNMYDDAINAFSQALQSDDIELQKKAYYNRGNSYYQKGAEMIQAKPEETVDNWKQALESLQAALELAPDDEDADHNYQLIKKQLEELEKQQQQQNNQQDQNKDQEKKKDDSQKQKSGQQNQEQNQQQEGSEQQSQEQQSEQSEQSSQAQQGNDGEKQKQQEGEQEQQAEGDEKKDGVEQPKPLNESEQENLSPAEQAKQDAERQQLGKMTREEAENLLNALKNEEGELNFVPSGNSNDSNIDKDW